MKDIIFFIAAIGWGIGVVISLLFSLIGFIINEKQMLKTGLIMFIIFVTTGWVTFFPLALAFFYLTVIKHEKGK